VLSLQREDAPPTAQHNVPGTAKVSGLGRTSQLNPSKEMLEEETDITRSIAAVGFSCADRAVRATSIRETNILFTNNP